MKDLSIFENVVLFYGEKFTYQAIRRDDDEQWSVAEMEEKRVLDVRDVSAPHDASPGVLLSAFFKVQNKAAHAATGGVAVSSKDGIWTGQYKGFVMVLDSLGVMQSFTGDMSNIRRSEEARNFMKEQVRKAMQQSKKGSTR